jgi:hypothetical protein
MGRPCSICSRPDKAQIEELILTVSDHEVARRTGLAQSSVDRHRRLHMLKVAEDRRTIIERDRAARGERQLLARGAASGAPTTDELVQATIGLRKQMEKLTDVERRLSRVADVAENEKHFSGVAALAGQQISALRYGSQLGGDRNFVPRTHEGQGAGGGGKFSIVIQLGTQEVKIAASVPTRNAGETVDEDGNTIVTEDPEAT